ncbi:hypothetical protein [Streptomyces sp. NPDC005435]|uniref:hypothetical protein n=1 Tax=Streptomyces sp. NPDC005435 TaxID=3154464 RepID=UPI0034558130
MDKRLRIVASTAAVAVVMGLGTPLASAATSRVAPVAAVAEVPAPVVLDDGDGNSVEYYPDVELGSEAEARAEGERVALGKLSALKTLLKKSPALFKSAVKSAKKGSAAFSKWVNGLSNFNPVKWAIKGSPDYVITELVNWLAHQIIS